MMIDIKTGVVIISDKLKVSPEFDYEDFKKTSYFKGQDSVRIIYLDEKQMINEHTYIVSLFFRKEKIYMVSLINCDEDISEHEEKKRKEKHDEILCQEGIVSGQEYYWGKVESEYDARSNISSINVYYNRREIL